MNKCFQVVLFWALCSCNILKYKQWALKWCIKIMNHNKSKYVWIKYCKTPLLIERPKYNTRQTKLTWVTHGPWWLSWLPIGLSRASGIMHGSRCKFCLSDIIKSHYRVSVLPLRRFSSAIVSFFQSRILPNERSNRVILLGRIYCNYRNFSDLNGKHQFKWPMVGRLAELAWFECCKEIIKGLATKREVFTDWYCNSK